jgi:hypothetical protein
MSRLPGDLPGRVDNSLGNHLVDGQKAASGRDDSYASIRSSSNAPTAAGPIALDRLRSILTSRELAVLMSVDRFRYLTALQLELLHFRDHASLDTAARIRRRVLQRLTSAGLLSRLERQVGGVRAGSAAFVYRLAPLGYRVVHDHASMSGRTHEPSGVFLDHTLAVAQMAIDVTTTSCMHSEIELLTLDPEPHCWRSFQKGLGGRETLKPDLFVALGLGDYEDHWFCEVDRGTESTTAVIKKCRTYLDYYRSGIEQQRYDVFPRVLWIVPNERRQKLIEAAMKKTRELRGTGIFIVVTTADALTTLTGGAQ